MDDLWFGEAVSKEIELRERVYNLSLYLQDIEDNHPVIFKKLIKKFNGLPGYAGKVEIENDGGNVC